MSGLVLGAVYAAFALALCMIWRSTRIVNFAQAAMAMVTTYIALELIDAGANYWVGFAAALIAGLALGAFVERVVVRPVEGKSEINAVILTLGLFMMIHALAALVFGTQYQPMQAPFSIEGLRVGDTTVPISPMGLFTIAAVGVVMTCLLLLFQYTDLGLRMRAAAFNPEVSRLLGVRVGRMLTLGWALAAMIGALAGLLIGSGSFIHPGYMDAYVVFGFVAAVLGGLDSPVGSVVGGLILGLTLSFVSGYLGGHLVSVFALAILIVVLLVRPGGLFSHVAERRV
nr:branched-chain amino acid ABC transporter permease [Rhodococcus sp. HNM0569]